jgi:hypothetical protein
MLFHAPLKILTRAKRANERIVECGLWNAECGLWIVECGMRIVDCGMRNADKETLNSVERCGQKS